MKMGIGRLAAFGAVLAAALVAGPGVRAEGGHEHHGGAPAAAVTFTGEVLDLACHLGHGAKGREHAACARTCLMKGAAPGLLTDDGTVYLLVEDHTREKAFKAVPGLAAARVKVTGKKAVQGGLQGIIVEKIEKI